MIAVLGARMAAAGDTIPVARSAVKPGFRPDEVPITWRSPTEVRTHPPGSRRLGAEATVEIGDETVIKTRHPKEYRHRRLDERLRRRRTNSEARLTATARRHGVPTPVVYDVDRRAARLVFERVGDADLQAALTEPRVRATACHLATLHGAGIVHGDPTTRNVRVDTEHRDSVVLIDFGLGYHSRDVEDFAVDLHVLEQSLAGTADDAKRLCSAAREAYRAEGDEAVLTRLAEVAGRGRYR
jgi:N6-L-threonylcarbamoyladenine synthase/protein kinase Bud32